MNLHSFMKSFSKGLPCDLVRILLNQLLKAVGCMHSNKICHRDIKPDNILIKNDQNIPVHCILTVIDLGGAIDFSNC